METHYLQQQVTLYSHDKYLFSLARLPHFIIAAMLILFASVLPLAAETIPDSSPLPTEQPKAMTIVFCNDGYTNPYHVEWLAGFETALTAFNDKFGGMNGYWKAASNLEDQLEQVRDEIEKGVDILFVNAISVDAIRPLVKKAQDKGIIWISVHNYLDIADYNFVLGDFENGHNQGLALATFFNGKANVGIMAGIRGMQSGEERLQGILTALRQYPDIKVLAQEPADWNTAKALNIADDWLGKYPNIDAISVVTDTYIYPAMKIANYLGRDDIYYFGYDGDKAILNIMEDSGVVKSDILLGARREGWNFVQLAYKIINNIPVPKISNFHTPLVLTDETYQKCLSNGFPRDIKVLNVYEALKLANSGAVEFGPDSIINEQSSPIK